MIIEEINNIIEKYNKIIDPIRLENWTNLEFRGKIMKLMLKRLSDY